VVIALLGGVKAEINAAFVMVNRLTLTGSTLRPQSIANKGRMAQGLKEKVWPLLEAGTIRPIIFKTFPLKDAASAHAELERADHVGKVMMTI
jgi:NADPH2:quinone reductase